MMKEDNRDRFICDRRPQNSQESSVGRIPATWLHNMFDESMDSLPADLLGSWWDSDLRTCSDAPEPPDDCRQLASTGIMMGDTNADMVLELAR